MFDTNELNKTRAFWLTLHLSSASYLGLNLLALDLPYFGLSLMNPSYFLHFCGESLLTWIQIELWG